VIGRVSDARVLWKGCGPEMTRIYANTIETIDLSLLSVPWYKFLRHTFSTTIHCFVYLNGIVIRLVSMVTC